MPSVSPAYSAQSGFHVVAKSAPAARPGEVGDDVEVMDRAFDQQRIAHLVAEQRAPRQVLAHVALEAEADRVDPAEHARAHDPAQRRLVLVEAMAHRDRHLAAGGADLARDPQRRVHRVGDRLLAQDVEPVRDGEVDDAFVMLGRHDDRAEVGGRFGERAARVGVAALRRHAEDAPSVVQRLGVGVDERHDLDRAVGDVRSSGIRCTSACRTRRCRRG